MQKERLIERTKERQREQKTNLLSKPAEEKKRQDALRTKDEEGLKKIAAVKKTNQRDVLRAQNEEEFKAKRAAEEKKRQDALRSKDEEGVKKMAAERKKIKEML